MYDIQGLIDAMSDAGRRTRSQYHLTLGALIDALSEADPALPVPGASDRLISYRGHYADLAVEPGGRTTVGELLKAAKAALDNTFTGYKGGDFTMGADTPLWLSPYGSPNQRAIVGCHESDGEFVLELREVSDE